MTDNGPVRPAVCRSEDVALIRDGIKYSRIPAGREERVFWISYPMGLFSYPTG